MTKLAIAHSTLPLWQEEAWGCHSLLATVLGPGPGLAESLPGVRCLVNRKGQGFAGE